MRAFFISIAIIFLIPTAALALSDAQMTAIAQDLSKTYPAITVTVVSQPIISGDRNPVMFRITPSGKPNFGNLFMKGRYDIIHKPDTPDVLGSYLCTMADQFVKDKRAKRADFLPGVTFNLTIAPDTQRPSFEIGGDASTLQAMIYGALTIWDALRNNYGKFNIFVRGYADAGAKFQKPLLSQYPYHNVRFFPLVTPNDPLLAAYFRKLVSRQIGNTYTNSDLPDLRATFLKNVIDIFLGDCSLNGHLTPKSIVLNGDVINQKEPAYRTIDLYFYAYEPHP